MHMDHCAAAKDFYKYGIECFSGVEQVNASSNQPVTALKGKAYANIFGWKVLPVPVPHDNTPNFAYLVESPVQHHKVFYITDFEYLPYEVKKFDIDTWLMEVNHMDDVEPDSDNYEHVLRGHSGLSTVQDIIRINQSDRTKNIIACHLSERNADEKLIEAGLRSVALSNVRVGIAKRGMTFEL